MSYTDKLLKSRIENLRLFTANINGRDAWYILRLDQSKVTQYFTDVESGKEIDLPDYGEILHKGWGSEPPAELVTQLEEEYA